MGNGFTTCCGEIQDCCRDVCGCCPCKFCKTTEVEVKATETIEHKIEKKVTPFGYGLIHAGVRTKDNTYTSPVLEVHTWRKSATQMVVSQASMKQTVALGGMQTRRDNANRHLGSLRGAERRRIELEGEITVIPVESILSIKSSSDIKKGETEYKNVRMRTPPPPVKLSCGKQCSRWCCTTFCCHDYSKSQISREPEEIITTISDQEAERKILITIEYIRYSNIDTPSHLSVLPSSDRINFFREHFHKDTIQFYLLDNYDFEQTDFDLKRMQASTLCRLVIQLKSMDGDYPDETTLAQIIGKPDSLAIGDPPQESMTRLTGSARITTNLELTLPVEMINRQDFF